MGPKVHRVWQLDGVALWINCEGGKWQKTKSRCPYLGDSELYLSDEASFISTSENAVPYPEKVGNANACRRITGWRRRSINTLAEWRGRHLSESLNGGGGGKSQHPYPSSPLLSVAVAYMNWVAVKPTGTMWLCKQDSLRDSSFYICISYRCTRWSTYGGQIQCSLCPCAPRVRCIISSTWRVLIHFCTSWF